MAEIDAVVFDIGKVLIDWNPRYLYRKLFESDDAGLERFLTEICTMEWHTRTDAGMPMADNVRMLQACHPDQADLIAAWDSRWAEMFNGPITGTVALLEALHERGVPLYAITNYPAEKFPPEREIYPFIDRFRDIVVSGRVGLAKPDTAIFELAAARFGIHPETTLFIDDNAANIAAAYDLGFAVHHFLMPEPLDAQLRTAGLL